MDNRMRIAVVYGGVSSEREPSLKSGQAAYEALRRSGFTNTVLFDFQNRNIDRLLQLRPDIALIALHGKGGEDGSIQGALELAGIPYTGSGVETSAVCMNKILTKRLLEALHIPTADYLVLHQQEYEAAPSLAARRLLDTLGLPLILKAPGQGSSIGVVLVETEEQLKDGIAEVFRYGNQLLAEKYLRGMELTLPILGNEELTVLPEIEMISDASYRSYAVKYTPGPGRHIIPARIPEATREQIQDIGRRLYRELHCRGCARIDFIVDSRKGPTVLEVNTVPALTATSALPASARAAGIPFEELVMRLLSYGLDNHRPA